MVVKLNANIYEGPMFFMEKQIDVMLISNKGRQKHHLLCEDYPQATNINVENFSQNLLILSIYSSFRFSVTENQYNNFYKSQDSRLLTTDNYNTKQMSLIFRISLNVISSCQLIY